MGGFVRFIGAAFASGAVLAVSVPALASASAHLVYVRGPGAESCPGEQAVRAAVGARLGYDPFFAWAHDTLFAEISRADGAFLVELKLVDERNLLRGARQLSVTGVDCAAAIDAAGLTISLTIDPASAMGSTLAPTDAPPAPQLEAQPETPLPDLSIPREAGAPRPRPRPDTVSAHVGLGAIGSIGAAPVGTLGGTLGAGVSWRFLSVDVEGRADLPASGASEGTSARVRSWLIAGSVVPCVHLGAPFGCFVLSAGSLGATSTGVAAPRDDHAPWSAAGVRAGAELPLQGSLSVRAYGELLATLTRNTLTIDGAPAYTFRPWSGGLGAALVWRFP
jgi:hypothetical protein